MIPNPPQQLLRATIFHTPRNPFVSENALEDFVDGGLLLGNGRVIACGDFGTLRGQHPHAVVRDLRGGFLLPGLVDTHIHFPQIRILGGLGLELLDWLKQHALPEEARLGNEDYARVVAKEFVFALAAHGTTTALVFGAHFQAATAALFETAEKAGLRVASGLVISDRLLRPELHQTPENAYRASKQLIRNFHGKGRLLYSVTPRFALSASEAMLEVCKAQSASDRRRIATACGQQSNRLALSLQQRSAGQRMVSIASPCRGRSALRVGDGRRRRNRLWLAERRAPGLYDAAARARRLPDRPSALTLSGNARWDRSSGT